MRRARTSSKLAILLTALLTSGCALMPATGPQGFEVKMASSSTDPEALPYALLPVTPDVVRVLARLEPQLSSAFANRAPSRAFRFGVGDTVSVTIFEAAAGGLFVPAEAGVRPGNFVTIPNQAVDNLGNVTVPFAGAVRAQGRTPAEVQRAIVAALGNRAIDPQAIVSLVEQRTSLVSVLGDVRAAGRFPTSVAGERILDAITRAGGPSNPGYDTFVTLERKGHRASVPFGALIYQTANNIFVLPDDVIYLYSQPQTFLAFGAADNPGQYKFDAWRLSLAEAMGKQGGLSDTQADPGSVFLYRGETRQVAELLGVDCTRFEGPIIPIVYNLNLRQGSGYFLAQSFPMRNKDVVYTSNAVSVETTKFLNFLRTIMATAADPIAYATNAYTLKALAAGTQTSTTIINPAVPIGQ